MIVIVTVVMVVVVMRGIRAGRVVVILSAA
jgi:hypothetical protein